MTVHGQNSEWNDEGLDIEEILAQWEQLASGVPADREIPEVKERDVDQIVRKPTAPILSPVVERLINEIRDMLPQEDPASVRAVQKEAAKLSETADISGVAELSETSEIVVEQGGTGRSEAGQEPCREKEARKKERTERVRQEETDDRQNETQLLLDRTKPLSRKETAKLIATGKTTPIPADEIADALAMTDTGFFVHSRYDVETVEDAGSRKQLTREQKRLFSYFIPVRGMSRQIARVLEKDEKCRSRNKTSRTGNILIAGEPGSGKTTLAVDLVKAIQKQRGYERGKAAVITGGDLNRKKIKTVLKKLYGGALIVQKAEDMNERTVSKLSRMMEGDTGEMLILLEGDRESLNRLLASDWDFRKKFTSYLEIPRFINDELITFAQTYAQEKGYSIDEMGILALYRRLDTMQRKERGVTVSEVKRVLDRVMKASAKTSPRKLVKSVIGKRRDSENRILLSERDFMI